MKNLFALALTTALVATASPSFAATAGLMHAYWIGR